MTNDGTTSWMVPVTCVAIGVDTGPDRTHMQTIISLLRRGRRAVQK